MYNFEWYNVHILKCCHEKLYKVITDNVNEKTHKEKKSFLEVDMFVINFSMCMLFCFCVVSPVKQ